MDLQATVEFAIEFYKFYNIDLFQRGFYQLKCQLKVAPKVLPIQIESSIGENVYPGQSSGVSQVFQILYRNEEVLLKDFVMFRTHILVDSRRLKESIERAEFSLVVELYFGDQNNETNLNLVSSRTLQLNFHPVLGLHYHLPVLFDYFHLCAVSLQINASLIVISTKYVNLQKNSKIWNNTTSKLNCRTPSSQLDFTSGQLDALFFGTQVGNAVRCAGGNSARLDHARVVHKEICELLLGALESLSVTLEEYNAVTPISYKYNRTKLSIQQRLKFLTDSAEIMENEDDFTSHANSNIAKLCAECVSLWRKVIGAAPKASIKNLLSKKNHTLRVRRFSEGFFVLTHGRHELNKISDRNDTEFCQIARTKYLASIPMLPVHCSALDGDAHTLPLIFEDRYEGLLGSLTKTTNGFFVPSSIDGLGSQSKITRSSSSLKRCSCTHLSTAAAGCRFIGMTTPRFALGSEILQASLTIIPTAARADLRGTSFRQPCCSQEVTTINRHSKSLDQLEHHNEFLIEPSVVEKTVPPNVLKNINEFKAKYKNPGIQELHTATLDRPTMKKSDELAHFNSLPKSTKQAPTRRKHYSKHSSTLPKSKSSQNLNKLQRNNGSLRYSRIRISDYKRSIGRRRRSIRGSQPDLTSSSSTEDEMVYEKCKMPRRKKIFSSMSVPFKLEHFNGNGEEFCESLPNLAPPAAFRNTNGKKSSPSSEESGDISSDSSPKKPESPPKVDATSTAPIEIDDIKLIPPEEFRDTGTVILPLPPAQFRDTSCTDQQAPPEKLEPKENGRREVLPPPLPPLKSHSYSKLNGIHHDVVLQEELSAAFDNPLYHICDIKVPLPKRPTVPPSIPTKTQTQAKILKSQSTNELFEIGRRSSSSYGSNCCSHASSPREIHKTIETRKKETSPNDSDAQPLLEFEKSREEFRKQVNYNGAIYSDFIKLASELPYFYINDELRTFSPNGLHLIVCVHGLDGNANDLRLFRTYLELGLPGANLDFLMSERNQGDTFSDFDTMTDRLVSEILYHIESYGLNPAKISFVAHSLGTILVRAALNKPQMKQFLPKMHTFLSLSGPHLGTLYNNSGLINMGMWFMQKWKKSGSLLQLCLRDSPDLRNCFLYRLSQKSMLHSFKNILLVGSLQDRYVPLHSARMEICKQAQKDNSILGIVYREMVHNVLSPIISKPDINLSRFDVHHALPKMMQNASVFIGRAAHIAVLDSELFIEKFLLVAGLKYFK